MESINLRSPLSFQNSFQFPIQNNLAKQELLWGALLLLFPMIGWILNLGHRIQMVHRMLNGKSPWPAWENYGHLFKHGLITFLGMIYYYSPAIILYYVASKYNLNLLIPVSYFLFLLGTLAIPRFMTRYCLKFEIAEIYDPGISLKKVFSTGSKYWLAWLITICALLLSVLGLLFVGIGFLVTSVWFWQVAGFSFASVLSKRLN